MKLTAIILWLACMQASVGGFAQTVTLSLKNASLEHVFKEIRKQTGYEFLYNTEMLEKAGKITIEIKNQPLPQALDACFKTLPLSYSITDKIIIVKPRKEQGIPDPAPLSVLVTIKGRVLDENGSPLVGASVLVKDTEKGGTTGKSGEFSLQYLSLIHI